MVAPAGITLYRVVTVKHTPDARPRWTEDGGQSEHSLYGQRFAPMVVGRWAEETVVADLVGPPLRVGDIITRRPAHQPQIGDLVRGAVTVPTASRWRDNYNAALRPPVIFCGDGRPASRPPRNLADLVAARSASLARPAEAPVRRRGGAGGKSFMTPVCVRNLWMTCAETRQTCVQHGDNNVDC